MQSPLCNVRILTSNVFAVALLALIPLSLTVADGAERRALTGVVRPIPKAAAIEPAKRVPRARSAQRLSRAQIAVALGVPLDALTASVLLEPGRLQAGKSIMAYYCPTEVLPGEKRASFGQSVCGGWHGIAISFMAVAGKRYLIDCAGTPADQTWTLEPWGGGAASAITVSGTEHPAFVYNASQNGIAKFMFRGSAESYSIQRCEITRTQ